MNRDVLWAAIATAWLESETTRAMVDDIGQLLPRGKDARLGKAFNLNRRWKGGLTIITWRT